jgi:hypothetical protein
LQPYPCISMSYEGFPLVEISPVCTSQHQKCTAMHQGLQ